MRKWKNRERINNKKKNTNTKQKDNKEKKVGMVILPYVKGCTEQLQRVFSKYKISTAVKPHRTLRNILVHPKDIIEKDKKCNVVYKVTCRNCGKCYIGETGRQLKTRIGEHQDDVKTVPVQVMTRSQRKHSTTIRHLSPPLVIMHTNTIMS